MVAVTIKSIPLKIIWVYSWWSALSKENCLEPCLSTQTMRERQRPFVLKNKYYQTNNDVSRKKQ